MTKNEPEFTLDDDVTQEEFEKMDAASALPRGKDIDIEALEKEAQNG